MKLTFTFILAFLSYSFLYSQTLDPSFGIGGKVILPFKMANASLYATALDTKDNLYVTGEASDVDFYYIFVTKFNSKGQIVSTFGKNGFWIDSIPFSSNKSYHCKGITTDELNNVYFISQIFSQDGIERLRKINDIGIIDKKFGNEGFCYLGYNANTYLAKANNGYIMGSGGKMASPDCKKIKEVYGYTGDLSFSSDGYLYVASYDGVSKIDTSKSFGSSAVLSFGNNGRVQLPSYSNFLKLNLNSSIFVTGNKLDIKDTSYLYKLKPSNGSFFNSFGKNGEKHILFSEGNNYITSLGNIVDKNIFLSAKLDGTGAGSFALCKLDTNGNFATSFGTNGRLLIPMGGTDASANALLVNSKNEVFAAGYTTINGQKQLAIIKLKDQPLSVEDLDLNETEVQVYPNPSKDVFYIKNAPEDAFVNVYNSLGLKVLSKNLKAQPTVNLAEFSSGNYLMEIVSETYRRVFKIELQ